MRIEVASPLERSFLDRINAERETAGLDPLKMEAHLNASAQAHSDWMADTDRLSHTGAGGSDAGERIADTGFPTDGPWRWSENLAQVSISGALDAGEARLMHEGLMDSPGHRANILDPDVAYVGIGLAVGSSSLGGRDHKAVFLTQNFADTNGEVLVQDEIDGETVLQPYQYGEPVGDPDAVDPPPDEDERESDAGGGCFVATAAYGDRLHPEVVALRRFRDQILARHPLGRAFIRAYGIAGPGLARLVSPAGRSGRLARALIAPLARRAARRTAARPRSGR